MDPLEGKPFEEAYLGGKKVQEYLDEGISKSDLQSYKPLEIDEVNSNNIQFHYLGYYLRWIPQEALFFGKEC